MEHLQRVVLLLLLCFVLLVPGYIRHSQNQYFIESWKKTQAECFFEELCSRGACTLEEYEAFCEKLSVVCTGNEIYLEEYQKEMGYEGKTYRYYVSWNEIKEKLAKEGSYQFQKGSEVRLYADGEIYYGQAMIWGE